MVECENQWHARAEKSDLMDFIVDSTPTMNPTTTWWRKYCVVVDNLHELLFNPTHNFTNEDRQHALRKFLDKDNVQGLLPQFVKDANDIKHKLGFFENLKIAYAQLVAQKSKENLSYRNTLLTTVVSNEVGLSQPHFEASVKMRLALPKVGTWSPPGLPKFQSLIVGVKTPRLEVLFIPLKRSWSVDVENGLLWAIKTFVA